MLLIIKRGLTKMAKTKVVSTRMTIQDLAKARDGLISKDIKYEL